MEYGRIKKTAFPLSLFILTLKGLTVKIYGFLFVFKVTVTLKSCKVFVKPTRFQLYNINYKA